MTTLAIYSNKGGVGKTAAAVNLSYLAARTGMKTLLCGLHPQGSASDRIRYYWTDPRVQSALNQMMKNFNEKSLPLSLLSQFVPQQYEKIRQKEIESTPGGIITDSIDEVLRIYANAV